MVSSSSGAVIAACPHCGAPIAPGDMFCEACGQDLPSDGRVAVAVAPIPAVPSNAPTPSPSTRCVSCGAVDQIATDGYCSVCGFKQPPAHDYEEHAVDGAAAVTDRGQHHHRNEDAVAIGRR